MLAGGKQTLMDLARLAPELDPSYAKVIEEYEQLSEAGKRAVSIDMLVKQKGLDPFHFLGVVAEAAIKFRDNASVLVAAMSLPKIIEASVKNALRQKTGFKDREALMKHAGFLPVPAGATFVNTLQTKVETNVGEAPASKHLPSFEQTVDAIDVEEV